MFKNHIRICLFCLFALISHSLLAQSSSDQIYPDLQDLILQNKQVKAYATPESKDLVKILTKADFTFPQKVLSVQGYFIQIEINNKQFWIKSIDFKTKRPDKGDCNIVAQNVKTSTDRGANENCINLKR